MNRTTRSIFVIACVSAAGLILGTDNTVRSQEKSRPKGKPCGGSGRTSSVWALLNTPGEMSTPGPNHQQLGQLVGTWNTVTTLSIGDGPFEVTKGTSQLSMEIDGRFLREESTFVRNSKSVQFIREWGYNADANTYECIFRSSLHTGMVFFRGTGPQGDKLIKLSGGYAAGKSGHPIGITLQRFSDDHFEIKVHDFDDHTTDHNFILTTFDRRR